MRSVLRRRETILWSTFAVTFFILLGKVGGFLREVLMVRHFGASSLTTSATDAFITALTLQTVIANAWKIAFPQAYVPRFHARAGAHRVPDDLLARGLTVTLGIVGPLCVAIALFASVIAPLISSNDSAAQVALTRQMLVLTSPVALLLALGTAFQSHQNAQGQFTWPAFSLMPFSYGGVLGLVIFVDDLGINALVAGTLVGLLLHVLLAGLPVPLRRGRHDREPGTAAGDSLARDAGGLFASGILLTQDFFVLVLAARSIGLGYVTYVYLCLQLVNIFGAPLNLGFTSAIFSRLSERLARPVNHSNNPASPGRHLFAQAQLVLLAATIPLMCIMWIGARPIATLLFGRGQFTDTDVAALGTLAPIYFISLFPAAAALLQERALAALRQPRLISLLRVLYVVALWGGLFLASHSRGDATSMTVAVSFVTVFVLANLLRYVAGVVILGRFGFPLNAPSVQAASRALWDYVARALGRATASPRAHAPLPPVERHPKPERPTRPPTTGP